MSSVVRPPLAMIAVATTPDGRRVLVVTPVNAATPPRREHTVVLIRNFFDELRRRVPPAK